MGSLTKFLLAVFVIAILITWCVIHYMGALVGGAGSLKAYTYQVPKSELEIAINNVLKNSSNVHRDTLDKYITEVDSNKNIIRHEDNYYNNGVSTLIININKDSDSYSYFIRYYGDGESWKSSTTTELGITYVNGYSEGEKKPNRILKKKFIDIFESEFIDKVDKQLGKVHCVSLD